MNVDGIRQYLLMMKDNNEQGAAAGAYHEPKDKPEHNYYLRNKTQGSQQVKMMTKYHTSLLLRAKWIDCSQIFINEKKGGPIQDLNNVVDVLTRELICPGRMLINTIQN